MSFYAEKPIAVLYEHPRWFTPLFHALDERALSFVKIDPAHHLYDPTERNIPFSMVYNDMSLSLPQQDSGRNIASRVEYLRHLEESGVPVINGAVATEISSIKTRQLTLFRSLGVKFPATRILNTNNTDLILPTAKALGFPVLVKTNNRLKGSIFRFEREEALATALIDGTLNFSLNDTILLQKFIPPQGNHIVRVETLNGKFQYALKIHVVGEALSVWPLEVRMEVYTPPAEVIQSVEQIIQKARIDVGSVEYITDRRNNANYFFDVNAYPSYSIEVRNVLGYDPYVNLLNYFEHRSRKIREIELAI